MMKTTVHPGLFTPWKKVKEGTGCQIEEPVKGSAASI
jgi:hypothetical protein